MKNQLGLISIGIMGLISVLILANTYKNRNITRDLIHVTGFAEKDFKADLIVWKGCFSRKNAILKKAYTFLEKDREAIIKHLRTEGTNPNDILFSAVQIKKEHLIYYDIDGNEHKEFAGYHLTQDVEINSPDVDKVERIAREITQLINNGIEIESFDPKYYCSKLSELKVEMIASATHDARTRAEKITEQAGTDLGKLKNARMGIFQITGKNSDEDHTWSGTLNTTAKMKTASITMKLQFGID